MTLSGSDDTGLMGSWEKTKARMGSVMRTNGRWEVYGGRLKRKLGFYLGDQKEIRMCIG